MDRSNCLFRQFKRNTWPTFGYSAIYISINNTICVDFYVLMITKVAFGQTLQHKRVKNLLYITFKEFQGWVFRPPPSSDPNYLHNTGLYIPLYPIPRGPTAAGMVQIFWSSQVGSFHWFCALLALGPGPFLDQDSYHLTSFSPREDLSPSLLPQNSASAL